MKTTSFAVLKTNLPTLMAVVAVAIFSLSTFVAQAQFNYTTNNGTITITGGCPSSPDAVTIPSPINGLPVTGIGEQAFYQCTSLTSITIPDSVTSIGGSAFYGCTNLISVTIDDGVFYIGSGAFANCDRLTDIHIGNGVTRIDHDAFEGCTSLRTIVIPETVADISGRTFIRCTSLTEVYFEGNAPDAWEGDGVFEGATNTTVYYLPGTLGWGPTYAERATALWVLPYPVILTTAPNFGIQTNAFGFRISWATNASVVVEASTTLANPVWSPVSTNTLTGGWCDFRDAEWMNHSSRFYRVRSL